MTQWRARVEIQHQHRSGGEALLVHGRKHLLKAMAREISPLNIFISAATRRPHRSPSEHGALRLPIISARPTLSPAQRGRLRKSQIIPSELKFRQPAESILKFTGKRRDAESQLDYMGARYYGSGVGRFTTPDLKGIAFRHLLNPQKFNKYTYVLNSPMSFFDPGRVGGGYDHISSLSFQHLP